MKVSKIKLVLNAMTGGWIGIAEYLLDLFNCEVLAKASPEEMRKYCHDVIALQVFLKTVAENHQSDMSPERLVALNATIDAVNALAEALVDSKVTTEELDAIIDRVKAAIQAWKDAK